MICNLCHGARWLVAKFPLEWWPCPKCQAHGATVQFGPATLATPENPND